MNDKLERIIKILDVTVEDVMTMIDEEDEEMTQANYQYILMRLQQARSLAKQVR